MPGQPAESQYATGEAAPGPPGPPGPAGPPGSDGGSGYAAPGIVNFIVVELFETLVRLPHN